MKKVYKNKAESILPATAKQRYYIAHLIFSTNTFKDLKEKIQNKFGGFNAENDFGLYLKTPGLLTKKEALYLIQCLLARDKREVNKIFKIKKIL